MKLNEGEILFYDELSGDGMLLKNGDDYYFYEENKNFKENDKVSFKIYNDGLRVQAYDLNLI